MAGTTQLDLYNRALEILGERSLASLSENREPRRVLDNIWNGSGGNNLIETMLSQGHWKFATRSSKMIFDPSYTALFGYQYAWAIPSDWVIASKVCSDEYLTVPMTRYTIEAGIFYTDWEYVFVSYVSKDNAYGGNLNAWPPNFVEYVACYMAARGCKRITQSEKELERLTGPRGDKGLLYTLKVKALSVDAMELPTQFLPRGAWTTARGGFGTTRRDGGSRSSLIG